MLETAHRNTIKLNIFKSLRVKIILPYVSFSSFKLKIIHNKKASSQIHFHSFQGNLE